MLSAAISAAFTPYSRPGSCVPVRVAFRCTTADGSGGEGAKLIANSRSVPDSSISIPSACSGAGHLAELEGDAAPKPEPAVADFPSSTLPSNRNEAWDPGAQEPGERDEPAPRVSVSVMCCDKYIANFMSFSKALTRLSSGPIGILLFPLALVEAAAKGCTAAVARMAPPAAGCVVLGWAAAAWAALLSTSTHGSVDDRDSPRGGAFTA